MGTTCTMTQDEISDRDTERRNVSVRVLFGIYGTSYGATLALPQRGGAHHVFFHLCIAITGFLARLFELKSGCYCDGLIYYSC